MSWEAIGALIFKWTVGLILDALKSLWSKFANRKKNQEQAKDDVQPLKDAQTGEEIDEATDDALRRM